MCARSIETSPASNQIVHRSRTELYKASAFNTSELGWHHQRSIKPSVTIRALSVPTKASWALLNWLGVGLTFERRHYSAQSAHHQNGFRSFGQVTGLDTERPFAAIRANLEYPYMPILWELKSQLRCATSIPLRTTPSAPDRVPASRQGGYGPYASARRSRVSRKPPASGKGCAR